MNIISYKLSFKIFISFLFIILIPSAIILIIGNKIIINSVENEIYKRLNDAIKGYQKHIKFLEKSCLNIARELSQEEEIIELLLKNDLNKLEQKLIKIYNLGIVDIIEIEDKNGMVLLRGHNPKIAGDIKIEQSIIKKGLSGKININYEKGKTGFAIRCVAPIKANNQIIGLLMIGSSFSKDFVYHIKLLTGMEIGIYKYNSKIEATYNGLEILENSYINYLENNKLLYFKNLKLNNSNYYLMLKPLFIENNYWGTISVALSNKEISNHIKNYKKLLSSIILIGIIISLIIYFFLAKNIHHSLNKIISVISSVQKGNFDLRINLKSKDEFEIISNSFNDMMNRIKSYNNEILKLQEYLIRSEKLATAGQISAGIAHELRNPLSSIKMMIQIIKNKINSDLCDKEINIILKEINRLNLLLKDLLEFSKPTPLHFIAHNINDLINNTLNFFFPKIEQNKIKLIKNFDNGLPKIKIDIEKMKIVFINLILNSIYAMPNGGILQITTKQIKNNKILIIISDTGTGIKKEDIIKIFEPFFTTKKEGTGLGLTLAKSIIERHNGEIIVKSIPNKITHIFIILNNESK
ncbi:MAG TPA: ATP-binding protein [bacterium]|nr:ATP-binding protein [bacterium]HOL47231.1 ATP-binding protein [bacterium]HPQ18260.1 ATP-binding protein [bacterium]